MIVRAVLFGLVGASAIGALSIAVVLLVRLVARRLSPRGALYRRSYYVKSLLVIAATLAVFWVFGVTALELWRLK